MQAQLFAIARKEAAHQMGALPFAISNQIARAYGAVQYDDSHWSFSDGSNYWMNSNLAVLASARMVVEECPDCRNFTYTATPFLSGCTACQSNRLSPRLITVLSECSRCRESLILVGRELSSCLHCGLQGQAHQHPTLRGSYVRSSHSQN